MTQRLGSTRCSRCIKSMTRRLLSPQPTQKQSNTLVQIMNWKRILAYACHVGIHTQCSYMSSKAAQSPFPGKRFGVTARLCARALNPNSLNWCFSHVKLLLLWFWYRHRKMIEMIPIFFAENYGLQERHRWSEFKQWFEESCFVQNFGDQAESFGPHLSRYMKWQKWQQWRQYICGGAPTVTLLERWLSRVPSSKGDYSTMRLWTFEELQRTMKRSMPVVSTWFVNHNNCFVNENTEIQLKDIGEATSKLCWCIYSKYIVPIT